MRQGHLHEATAWRRGSTTARGGAAARARSGERFRAAQRKGEGIVAGNDRYHFTELRNGEVGAGGRRSGGYTAAALELGFARRWRRRPRRAGQGA